MSKTMLHRYEGSETDVTWDERLCIHISECSRATGDLFVSGRHPWCVPDLVQIGEVKDVVERCPSGALVYHPKDGSPTESASFENTVMVVYNGPLYLRGDLDIERAEDGMAGVRFRAALCRCGKSERKPFCDNAHDEAGFRDSGAVGKKSSETDRETGNDKLVVRCSRNGPLLLSGHFKILAASSRVAWVGNKAALCRCGHSEDKPFCDGSHKRVKFQAP